MAILPDSHALYHTFAIGPEGPATKRKASEKIVGFTLNERVRVLEDGQTGKIITINPADGEVGVVFTKVKTPLWFKPNELEHA
jgi:dsDNA-specific endonuclease/ATPase MutS2